MQTTLTTRSYDQRHMQSLSLLPVPEPEITRSKMV